MVGGRSGNSERIEGLGGKGPRKWKEVEGKWMMTCCEVGGGSEDVGGVIWLYVGEEVTDWRGEYCGAVVYGFCDLSGGEREV